MKVTVTYGQKRPGPEPYTTDDLHVTFEDFLPEGTSFPEHAEALRLQAKAFVEENMPKYERQAAPAQAAPSAPPADPAPASPEMAATDPFRPENQPQAAQGAQQAPAGGGGGAWYESFNRICDSLRIDPADNQKREGLERQLVRHFAKSQSSDGRWFYTMAGTFGEWTTKPNRNGKLPPDFAVTKSVEGMVAIAKALEMGDTCQIQYNSWNRERKVAEWPTRDLISMVNQPGDAPNPGGPPQAPQPPATQAAPSAFPGEEDFQQPQGGGLPDDVPF